MSSLRVCPPTSWIPPNNPSFNILTQLSCYRGKKKFQSRICSQNMDPGLWIVWVPSLNEEPRGTPVSGTLGGPALPRHRQEKVVVVVRGCGHAPPDLAPQILPRVFPAA